MPHSCHNRPFVDINPAALILLAAGLLILPVQWIGAAVLAGTVHELFHLAALYLCGGRLHSITMGGNATIMNTSPVSMPKQILATLAGPVGSLCLLLFWRILPRTAICAAVHAAYNLLPLYPLDGGRVVKTLTERLFSLQTAGKIQQFFNVASFAFLCALGIYTAFALHLGILPFLLCLMPAVQIRRNSACKPGQFTIQ